MTHDDCAYSLRRIRGSLVGAAVLLAWEAALSGSFLVSILVCPVWCLVSLVKNVIWRPGWRVALSRTVVPALTLGLVLSNAALQSRIAHANAERIIKACEQFSAANGRYPSKLDELVPGYLPAVPRAKYCLMDCDFWYLEYKDRHTLMWVAIPFFSRPYYDFEERRWGVIPD